MWGRSPAEDYDDDDDDDGGDEEEDDDDWEELKANERHCHLLVK